MIKLTKLMTILLALCLITTSFAGSTLAKFTTGASANDIARVAKWGVKISPFDGLFRDAYKNSPTVWTEDNGDNSITVRSDTQGTNIIAPGTQNMIYGITITGTPEVAVRIDFDVDLELTGWEVDGEFYFPITIYTSVMPEDQFYGLEYTSAEEYEKAVEESIKKLYSVEFPPNTDLESNSFLRPYIFWHWPFFTTKENIAKDTALGDASVAALEDDDPYTNPPSISLTVTTTVTQID